MTRRLAYGMEAWILELKLNSCGINGVRLIQVITDLPEGKHIK
jgi:hypothetical protein